MMFEWPTVDWSELRRHRRERVGEVMRRHGLDHLLLTSFENHRYALDYRSMLVCEGFDWFATLSDEDGQAVVFVPWIAEDIDAPDPRMPWIRRQIGTPSWVSSLSQLEVWVRLLEREIKAARARKLGVDCLSFQMMDALRTALSQVEFVPIFRELERIRYIKHPTEIRLLEAAGHVNSIASAAAIAAAREGITDFEILAAAMDTLQRMGVEYMTHSLCITRGSQLAGNWFAKGRRVWEGDPFFFDIGCYGIGGYASDMARTGFLGEPAQEIRHGYAALLAALGEGLGLARPGVRVSKIFHAINTSLTRQGFAETPYSMGHGIGLRACEAPIIYREDMMVEDTVLEEGMAIALEPQTTVESHGAAVVLKVEDSYAVERGGLRRLTPVGYGPGSAVGP